MRGVQCGFEGFCQFAGTDMVAAKAFDPAAGYFQNMKEVPAGGYNLIKHGVRVPIMALQAVVLALVLIG